MATIKYLCRECGTEVKTAVDEVAFCEAHPSAVIESVVVAEEAKKFIAVAGQDEGTCEALGWAGLSIKPFVVAQGSDADEVAERAAEALGHDDVVVREVC